MVTQENSSDNTENEQKPLTLGDLNGATLSWTNSEGER